MAGSNKYYKCGWNTTNHTVTVMAVSLAQAKFKCNALHGAYPDWAEAEDYAVNINAQTAESLNVSKSVAKTVNFGVLYMAGARAHELSMGGQDG